ncbi:sugar ABC transporter ATP-binding protein [Rossellomorea aquimaris]|uniref:sugar ABC transporter ATP-binding protein n=1 Tax=Rossellomorea aquimaris TaxID=189382 RepID=UPI001CD806DF|nr:sugar ABC transporter ATP-binding protein [Rossellomorea aquimaris]MCA1055082.1 sugar ABC transporter ATP-binding protein [Rossellomorea aquimaris]
MSTLLEMSGIRKSFAGVKVLKDAQFHLKEGEVHALLGANGAGKSTLMKILSGAYTQDEGDICLHAEKKLYQTPKEAKLHGIHCVYQEVDTAIVHQLSVAENILLDRLSTGGSFFLNKRSLEKEAGTVLQRIGAGNLSLGSSASSLSLAEKQLVLIARALLQDAKVLILDEPTAPLSLAETDRLFDVMEELKKEGVGIVFISHRLPEVFGISDRITVMRDGETVDTLETTATSPEQVVDTMLGGSFRQEFVKQPAEIGEQLIEVKGLDDGGKLGGIDLSLREGEVVGVVGLVGAGKTELAKSLFGASPVERGSFLMKGSEINLRSPRDAVKNGIALVPEERRKEGLFIHESVQHNLSFPTLKTLSRTLWINRRAERKLALQHIESLGIRTAHEDVLLNDLSGGNQQKVSIGKWLTDDASVFLFDEPTKGVDVGAKKDIFNLIQSLAQRGKGILYFSCEIQEILAISDRILIMFDGRIVKELNAGEATQETILLYASGGTAVNEREDVRLTI